MEGTIRIAAIRFPVGRILWRLTNDDFWRFTNDESDLPLSMNPLITISYYLSPSRAHFVFIIWGEEWIYWLQCIWFLDNIPLGPSATTRKEPHETTAIRFHYRANPFNEHEWRLSSLMVYERRVLNDSRLTNDVSDLFLRKPILIITIYYYLSRGICSSFLNDLRRGTNLLLNYNA